MLKFIKRIFIALGIGYLTFSGILGPLSYKFAISSLNEQAKNHLISVREIKKGQIENYFSERKGDVALLSRNPLVIETLPWFIEAFKLGGPTSPEYKQIEITHGNALADYAKQYGYRDLILIDTGGTILFAAQNRTLIGIDLAEGGMEGSNIIQAFKKGMLRIELTDFTYYEPFDELTAFISAPVRDKAGMIIGVLVFQIPFNHVDRIMAERAGLGQTGETYLVGEDKFMRSNSRFSAERTALKLQVDTEASRDALDGYEGVKVIRDYRGVPVLSAYGIIGIGNFFWAILCEIDVSEAFQPAIRLRRWASLIAGSIIGIVAIYCYAVHRRFTAPQNQK